MPEIKKPVKLFWTGGWDSTFRLIQLVLTYKKTVQPYYIIDHNRNSLLHEFRAMANIKNGLIRKNPDIKDLILPTIFKELNGISEIKTISESYCKLIKVETIAIQYEWLARFCADEEITDMEICNETAIYDADNRSRRLMGDDLKKIESDYGNYYKLSNKTQNKDLYNIYGNFDFPVFDYTKLDMFQLAQKEKFVEVLKLTWFCLMPTKFSNPCGKCHPCRVVYREGLKWRLPLTAKFRYHTWPTLRKIAGVLHIKY